MKLQQYKEQEAQNKYPISDINWTLKSQQETFKEGFDKAMSLDLPIKFAEWASANFWHYSDIEKAWGNLIQNDVKTSEELYQYWLENILEL